MTLTPGTRLGPYEILGPLGEGGMGVVFRARDTRLGRNVAVKALAQELAEDADRLERIEREARILASLNHPNIATIYGLEDVDGVPHLILELIDGETLAASLTRGPLEPRQALEVAVQIAAAIEAAHERGIVHRDLKPGNIMLDASGTAKVLDFGLAKEGRDDASGRSSAATLPARAVGTIPGTILGTAAYMSPEQARGLAVDRRSDVWSFGCILFECLTGRPPFEGATPSDLIAGVLGREPAWRTLPPALAPGVRDVLKRCLRKESNERPRDIRDVRLELAAAVAGRVKVDGASDESIAVLPFTHASGLEDEYFADGITEEILNALAHIEGLRVAARTSSFAFKGRTEDLRQIAERLDVSTVLEGSVRRAGNRLRITAQLVKAADGYQLWSERYDRELTDVFDVQDEIANAIATRLKLTLAAGSGRAAGRGTSSPEAYENFLKGRAVLYRRGRFILEAQRYFERALELDPDYAEALAWMSDSYRLMGTFGMAPTGEVMPKARAAAERSLALDPNLAEAHATLADVEVQYERDYARAAESWRRALSLDPRHTRARCERALWSLGHGGLSVEEAFAEVERAVADDPLNAWAVAMQSNLNGLTGHHEESIACARRAVEIDSSNYFAQWNLLRSNCWAGRFEEAVQLGPALLAASGRQLWTLSILAAAYAGLGRLAEARAIYDELEARSRWEFIAPSWFAIAALSAGLRDEGLALARRGVEERDPFMLFSSVIPHWDPLRNHPGFRELIPQLGLSERAPRVS